MSVNVLEYNEAIEQVNTLRNTTLPAQRTCFINLANTNGRNAGQALAIANACKQANFGIRLTCDLQTRPWDCRSWSSIPTLNNPLGTIRVCDATTSCAAGQLRCGATCTWTVPSNATFARFQVWGAGAGSHNMCCCGVGLWGGSGAYASVILPVTPGSQYIMCAGCAQCCIMRDAGPTSGGGCSSWVTGPGLCNFCADGGEASMYCMLLRSFGGTGGYCVLSNVGGLINKCNKGTVYGYCMCSGGGFCWNNNCSGRDAIPFTTSCRTWYGCVTNPSRGCHFVIGAPGMFNSVNTACTGDGVDGWQSEVCLSLTHPPIVNLTCDACCRSLSVSTTCAASCHGHIHCGVFPFPSRGGAPSMVGGGCDNCGGGIAGGGLVIVEWNGE